MNKMNKRDYRNVLQASAANSMTSVYIYSEIMDIAVIYQYTEGFSRVSQNEAY